MRVRKLLFVCSREELEGLNDVTKKKNLNDFYKNFYSSNSGFGSEVHTQVAPHLPEEITRDAPTADDHTEMNTQVIPNESLSSYDLLRLTAEKKKDQMDADGQHADTAIAVSEPKDSNDEAPQDDRGPEREARKERNHEDALAKAEAARKRYQARKRKMDTSVT